METSARNPKYLRPLIWLIRLYQITISPDHGVIRVFFPRGACRYTPTCSQYMIDALSLYGAKGFFMGMRRVGRCHPFARGGFDPVIPSKTKA